MGDCHREKLLAHLGELGIGVRASQARRRLAACKALRALSEFEITIMMPNQTEPGSIRPDDPTPAGAPEVMRREALARRQLLLRGLSKGGAAVVAFVPIRTLAQSSTTILVTTDNTLCTQSGQMSNVMSRTLTKVTCTGYGPTHYAADTTPWPLPNFKMADKNSLRFNALFSISTDTRKVQDILKGAPSTDAAYWIAANFNSRQATTLNFPYTLTDVIAQFNQYAGGSFGLINLYRQYLSSLG
jgi:hypothetical protein